MKKKKLKKKICVVGMGYVGSVSAIIFANIMENKTSKYDVIGIEKNDKMGQEKINKLNSGKFITKTNDSKIQSYLKKAKKLNSLSIKSNYEDLKTADYVVIAVNLDLKGNENKPKINFSNLIKITNIIGASIKKDATIILETTVPPGTCDTIIMPIILKNFKIRQIKTAPNIIHSYERVTPGKNYIKSIKKSFRIYSSSNKEAEKKFKFLYRDVIDLKKFSLIKLDKFIESESAKILENSYRAVNIAFIQEWTHFSLENKLSISKILNVIKLRKTHNNIMRPGLGVGGYCLTKDPLFAYFSNREFFKNKNNKFEISRTSMRINRNMPNFTYKIVKDIFKNKKKLKIAVFGITYKEDVGDIRFSPSKALIEKLEKNNFNIDVYDPLIDKLPQNIKAKLNLKFDYDKYDLIIFIVKNKLANKINFSNFRNNKKKIHIIDTDNCLNKKNIDLINKKKLKFINLNA